MDGVGGDAAALEKVGKASAQDLGVDEYQRLGVGAVAQQVGKQVALHARRHRVHHVGDRL